MTGKNGSNMSESHVSDNHGIALIDKSTNLSKLKSLSTKSITLITFDYSTHKTLENLSQQHILSDTFLESSEKNLLQQNCYEFSKWYDQHKIQDQLIYDDINLGRLSYIEFFVFLLPFLKKFAEIKKIFHSNPNSTFLASGLLANMMQCFTSNVEIFDSSKSDENFIYDEVNFETNAFKIKLSKKNFSKLQNIFEKTISGFLPKNSSTSKNSIFLVEFNTVLYGKLFKQIFDSNFIPVYLGVRRPAIWNKTSYSVVKNSQTKIASFSNIPNDLKQIIDTESTKFTQNWKSLFEKENFFATFFTYDGISFWSILKPYFLKLFTSRIKESISIIEITKNYFQQFNPKSVFLLSESGFAEQIVSSLAIKFDIPTVLFQHGVGTFDSKKSDVINEFTGSMPVKSNKFVVWGESMKKYSLQFGIAEDKIHVLGSIAHEKLFSTDNNISTDYILLAPEPPGQININDYDVSVNEEYENTLRDVCKIAVKLNKKLIIKIKPHILERNETEIAHSVDPSIQVLKSGDMSDLVNHCSIFITFGITSAMLDASYFKKPIIRIRMREWWDSPDILRPSSGIPILLDDLEATLDKLYSDTGFHEAEIQNRTNFLNSCLSYQNSVSEKIDEFLTSLK